MADEEQTMKQTQIVKAMLTKPEDCMQILMKDCPEAGVDLREPIRIKSCRACREKQGQKEERWLDNILQFISTGKGCSADCTTVHYVGQSFVITQVWLFDVAAYLGNVEVLFILPSLFEHTRLPQEACPLQHKAIEQSSSNSPLRDKVCTSHMQGCSEQRKPVVHGSTEESQKTFSIGRSVEGEGESSSTKLHNFQVKYSSELQISDLHSSSVDREKATLSGKCQEQSPNSLKSEKRDSDQQYCPGACSDVCVPQEPGPMKCNLSSEYSDANERQGNLEISKPEEDMGNLPCNKVHATLTSIGKTECKNGVMFENCCAASEAFSESLVPEVRLMDDSKTKIGNESVNYDDNAINCDELAEYFCTLFERSSDEEGNEGKNYDGSDEGMLEPLNARFSEMQDNRADLLLQSSSHNTEVELSLSQDSESTLLIASPDSSLQPHEWKPRTAEELTALCRHTSSSCLKRRDILISSITKYMQHAKLVDVELIVEILKVQPCTEDVISVFTALSTKTEVAEGAVDLSPLAVAFAGTQGAHSHKTALMIACCYGNEKLLQPLLSRSTRACINAVDTQKMTALQYVYDVCYYDMYPKEFSGAWKGQSNLHNLHWQTTQRILLRKRMARTLKSYGAKLAQDLQDSEECFKPTKQEDGAGNCLSTSTMEEVTTYASSRCMENSTDLDQLQNVAVSGIHVMHRLDKPLFLYLNGNKASLSSEMPMSGDAEEADLLKRQRLVHLCKLAWRPFDEVRNELEELSSLFDQEITIKGVCQACSQGFLFPDLLVTNSVEPIVLFFAALEDNEEMFETMLRGECACASTKKVTLSFLAGCAAAAAKNMELLCLMLDKYIERVQTLRGIKDSRPSSARSRNKSVQFTMDKTQNHSPKLLAQVLRQTMLMFPAEDIMTLLDDPRVRDILGSCQYSQMSLLDMALRIGDQDTFLRLVDIFGKEIRGECDGLTPLLLAVSFGNIEMAKDLLKKGAKRGVKALVDRRITKDSIQIALALEPKELADNMALMLLEEGEGRLDNDYPYIPCALESAIIAKSYAVISHLLQMGQVYIPHLKYPYKEYVNEFYWSPAVAWACEEHHYEMAEFLVEQGFDWQSSSANTRVGVGSTPFHSLCCTSFGDTEGFEVLLDTFIHKGADLNGLDHLGNAPLELALGITNIAMRRKRFTKLIIAGAIVDSPLSPYKCQLYCRMGYFDKANEGAQSDQCSVPIHSLLRQALNVKDYSIATMMLKAGYRAQLEDWFTSGKGFPPNVPADIKTHLHNLVRGNILPLTFLCRRRMREIRPNSCILEVFLRQYGAPSAVVDFVCMKDLSAALLQTSRPASFNHR